MKKSPTPSSIALLGSLFSIFAIGITIWLLFFADDQKLHEQTLYWFLVALAAAIIPNIKQLKWKDLEIHLNEIESKVDEIGNRRYANLIYLIDTAGNLAMVFHPQYKVWLPCGTRLITHEQPHQAVHRAVLEELGIAEHSYTFWPEEECSEYGKVRIVPRPYQVQEEKREHRDGVLAHYDFVYVCKTKTEKPTLSGDEELKARWVSYGELEQEVEEAGQTVVTFADVLPTYRRILVESGD